MISITISIPAYNDKSSLQELLKDIDSLRKTIGFEIKVLIIDDCSWDGTIEVAQNYVSTRSNVSFIKHEKNKGFGPTFKEAFTIPKTDWVFFVPADNQFPINNLLKLRSEMQHYDFILGSRVIREDNWRRKLNSKIYNTVISLLAQRKIKDVNSIVLFRKKIIDSLELNSESAFVNAELILKAMKNGCRFIEKDIVHRERAYGVGSGGRWSVIKPVIQDTFRYVFNKL